MNILTCLCCPVPNHLQTGIGIFSWNKQKPSIPVLHIEVVAISKALRHELNIILHCTYLRCDASCRTWYNFNKFRFRKEVLYLLIPRSFKEASPHRFPHRVLLWTHWGPRRSSDPSSRSTPP